MKILLILMLAFSSACHGQFYYGDGDWGYPSFDFDDSYLFTPGYGRGMFGLGGLRRMQFGNLGGFQSFGGSPFIGGVQGINNRISTRPFNWNFASNDIDDDYGFQSDFFENRFILPSSFGMGNNGIAVRPNIGISRGIGASTAMTRYPATPFIGPSPDFLDDDDYFGFNGRFQSGFANNGFRQTNFGNSGVSFASSDSLPQTRFTTPSFSNSWGQNNFLNAGLWNWEQNNDIFD